MSWYDVLDPRTWFKGRDRGPAPNERSVSDAVAIARGRTRMPPKRDMVAVLDAYGRMPRLRALVDLIGNKGASTQWLACRARKAPRNQVRAMLRAAVEGKPAAYHAAVRKQWLKQAEKDGLIQQLETHPVLEFLDRPSPFFSGHDARKMMMIHRELAGESFAVIERYRPVREGVLGKPEYLLPFAPHDVSELPSSENEMHYKLRLPDGRTRYVHHKDALFMRDANPLDPYGRGIGIARTLANELDVDEYAAQAAAALFYNNGTPDTIVVMPGIGEDEGNRLKEKWRDEHGGPLKRRVPYFTDNGDIKVEHIGGSFVDMDLANIRKVEWDIIRQTWGVPPEALGDVSNSNRATITQAAIVLGSLVLVPRLNSWEDTLNGHLMPNWPSGRDDVDTFVTYESPVPTDADMELRYADLYPWARSFDDSREAQGLPRRGDKIGEMHMVPSGMVLVSLEKFAAQSAEALKPAVVEQPAQAPAPTEPAVDADGNPSEPVAGEGDTQAAATGTVQAVALNGAQVTSALDIVEAVAAGRLPRESAVAMLMNFFGLSAVQADAILGEVGRTFVPAATPEEQAAAQAPKPPASEVDGEDDADGEDTETEDDVAETEHEKKLRLALAVSVDALPVEQRAAVRRVIIESAARGERRREALARVRDVVPQTTEGRKVLAAVAASYGRRRARMRGRVTTG